MMTRASFIDTLAAHIKARYAIIGIATHEDERCLEGVMKIGQQIGAEVYCWTHARGIHQACSLSVDSKTMDLKIAIDKCEDICKGTERSTIFVFFDVAAFLEQNSNPVYRRRFRDFAQSIRGLGYKANCVLVSTAYSLAADLHKEAVILDLPLPSRSEIKDIIQAFCNQWKDHPDLDITLNANDEQEIVDACLGLTRNEIENSLARSLVQCKSFSRAQINIILEEKEQIIRQSGILEFINHDSDLSSVGGLESLKHWLFVRKKCFSEDAKSFGIRNPKGVLLVGIPGCGKSLIAKCISSSWSMPLMRLDLGKVFQGVVGASESNIRSSLNTAAVVSPCILWIDEIDKGLGASGTESDGGTSSRVFGTILTWMQENTAPVFVFATANQINKIPPELLRKGRFDEVFFVDLPSEAERLDIIRIHLSQVGLNPEQYDLHLLASECGPARYGDESSLTGAEIEAWIQSSLINSYSTAPLSPENCSAHPATETLISELSNIIPLAKQRAKDFMHLREWANENAVSASGVIRSSLGNQAEFGAGRKLVF
jgi:ATP-dependent 26S proteasome regulatory subunit